MVQNELILALVALGLGSGGAMVVVASRTPWLAGWLGDGHWFRSALVLHVDLTVVAWFMAMAALLAGAMAGDSVTFARSRGGWRLGMAGLGMTGMVLSPFLPSPWGGGAAAMNNYLPVLDDPLFLGGLTLLVAGSGWGVISGATCEAGSWRMGKKGVEGAAIVILATLLEVVWTGWELALAPPMEPPVYYEFLFWGGGHCIQLAHTLLMTVAWLWLAWVSGWRPTPVGSRVVFWTYRWGWLPVLLLPLAHWAGPVASPERREFYTLWMSLGSWWPALLVAMVLWWGGSPVSGSQTTPWLRQLTGCRRWSMALFLAGLGLGAGIRGDNLMVTAHYHATVGAVTLSYLGVVGMLLRGRGRLPEWVRWLPFRLYGVGLSLMVGGLAWLGWLAAPRKAAWVDPPFRAAEAMVGVVATSLGGGIGLVGLLAFAGTGLLVLTGREDDCER